MEKYLLTARFSTGRVRVWKVGKDSRKRDEWEFVKEFGDYREAKRYMKQLKAS